MNTRVALILAGGDSTRLSPLRDKVTMAFAGTSLIGRTVTQLRTAGWEQIVIVAHRSNTQTIADMVDAQVQVIEQVDPDGMAGAVRSAAAALAGKSVLIIGSSDVYEDHLYTDIATRIAAHPEEGILTGVHVDQYFPGGYLTVEGDRVTKIVEKPDPAAVPSDMVAVVCDYFPSADVLLRALAQVSSANDDTFEHALQYLLEQSTPFRFLRYEGFWGYIKYPWHVLRVTNHLLSALPSHRGKNVTIDPTAMLQGEVYCEDGVRILEHAKIIGPVYLGAGTIVGNGTMIRESIIGAGCVVGFGTEITRSYIGNQCWFHKNYIGDSVLSDEVYFGAGAVTANYRLDGGIIKSMIGEQKIMTDISKLGTMIGRNVHIGVNVSLLPGVKIGQDSFVSSGVVLDADLPVRSFCALQKGMYIVKENTHQAQKTDDAQIRGNINF